MALLETNLQLGPWKTSSSEMRLNKTDFAGEATRGDEELPSRLYSCMEEPWGRGPWGVWTAAAALSPLGPGAVFGGIIALFFSFNCVVVQVLSPVHYTPLNVINADIIIFCHSLPSLHYLFMEQI